MSKEREQVLFPVGRLVGGSLYAPRTHDNNGKLLTFDSGPNIGQPRVEFIIQVAIKKGGEQSWAQTEWGQKIYNLAAAKFVRGEIQLPSFAWKVTDGDSQIINMNHVRWCDKEGYPGHWVLKFTGGFAPSLVKPENGLPLDLPPDTIYPGCFIQVIGNVSDNISKKSAGKPGVYLNHSHVAFCGYGDRIFSGIDPKTVAWSREVPAGASPTPLGVRATPGYAAPITPSPAIVPYPQILNVPGTPQYVAPAAPLMPVMPAPVTPVPASAPVRQMLPAANGFTYEQLINSGWTDITLIQQGLMSA